jgi:hypothetical protein
MLILYPIKKIMSIHTNSAIYDKNCFDKNNVITVQTYKNRLKKMWIYDKMKKYEKM